MGAGHSSAGKEDPAEGVKTSYYELLGVQRSATEEELKKAYRRKALELHPDRNYGDEEHATKVFAEVQAAYEVLSDAQERAWYDSHESAILRGDDVGDEESVPSYENVRITTADDLARMVRKFNSGVEFSDAPSGFFGFLRETFEQLAKEEEIAADWEGTEVPEYPTFGHKDDAYDDVVKRFYPAWSSFATAKNFSWKDKYRLSEAPDRWYRRRMEQENKKLRQDGVREFNDAVRSLVAFVRKRDPRYVPSTQTEDERQKILRDAAAAQRARARAENEAKMQAEVPEWTKSREPDPLAEMEGTCDEEEEEEQVFECVACNKIFKSERQWEAHEKSKKHQKAVRSLQQKMKKDNANLDMNGVGSGSATLDVDEYQEEEILDNVASGPEDDEAWLKVDENGVEQDQDNETVARIDEGSSRAPAEKQDVPADDAKESPSASDSEDEDYASPETVQARLASATIEENGTKQAKSSMKTADNDDQSETAAQADQNDDDDDVPQRSGKKMGKAAQKRAKKAAATAAGEEADANHKCAGCDAAFPTKTRLFQHLRDHPKHAALKPAAAGGGKKKKGKR